MKKAEFMGFKLNDIIGAGCGIFLVIVILVEIIIGMIPVTAGLKDSQLPADALILTGSAPGRNDDVVVEVIATEDTIADDLDRRIRTERALKLVNTALDPRERQIIVMRYGLGEAAPKTQREVAALLGISRSYVSRIEKAALEKLRSGL